MGELLEWWNILDFIMELLHDSMTHYVVGFAVGCLAYYWIWTTLYAAYKAKLSVLSGMARMGVVYSIHLSVILLSFCFAFLSHLVLDGLSCWYFTPIDMLLIDGILFCPR